jgi:hypothetical protein
MTPEIQCTTFLCNGADAPTERSNTNLKHLNYLPINGERPNVNLGLPNFVRGVYHIPARSLDLLEIAAFVFAGDRLTSRGRKDAVEFHSWPRSFHFAIRVRDFDFWSRDDVRTALAEALEFVTGDFEYRFTFQSGHSTPPADLFDREEFVAAPKDTLTIALFSGGLDSLAGIIQRVNETDDTIYLVSHQSRTGTTKTQRSLFRALVRDYPDRVVLYPFRTNLKTVRAAEESQRTRSFLFGSIALVLANTYSTNRFAVFENGVTSINFTRRDELLTRARQ